VGGILEKRIVSYALSRGILLMGRGTKKGSDQQRIREISGRFSNLPAADREFKFIPKTSSVPTTNRGETAPPDPRRKKKKLERRMQDRASQREASLDSRNFRGKTGSPAVA